MDEVAVFPHFPSRSPNAYLKYSTDSSRNVFPSHSSLTAVHYSDVKSFDVEADMAEALMPPDPDARPKHFRSTFEECVFVFTVMMAAASTTFLQGVTIINTATIGKDLHMSVAQVTWISAALGYEHTNLSSLNPKPDKLAVSPADRSCCSSERLQISSAVKFNFSPV